MEVENEWKKLVNVRSMYFRSFRATFTSFIMYGGEV